MEIEKIKCPSGLLIQRGTLQERYRAFIVHFLWQEERVKSLFLDPTREWLRVHLHFNEEM